jgi:hypothetical protein
MHFSALSYIMKETFLYAYMFIHMFVMIEGLCIIERGLIVLVSGTVCLDTQCLRQ